MNDTHETNLPVEETGKLEETKAPETTPENTAEAVVTNETPDAGVAAEETSEAEVKTDEVAAGEETVATTGKLSKEEILEKLTGLVGAAADTTRNEVEALKQAYYKIHRSEVDELKKAFLTAGGEEKDFVAPEDETESKIKELLNVYKRAPEKDLIFTESSIGTWNNGHDLTKTLLSNMESIGIGTINNYCSAVTIWNLMLETDFNGSIPSNNGGQPNRPGGCQTCFGAVDLNMSDLKTIYMNSHYYMICHIFLQEFLAMRHSNQFDRMGMQ